MIWEVLFEFKYKLLVLAHQGLIFVYYLLFEWEICVVLIVRYSCEYTCFLYEVENCIALEVLIFFGWAIFLGF